VLDEDDPYVQLLRAGDLARATSALLLNKELDDLWSDPQVFEAVLASMPYLNAIRGGSGDAAARKGTRELTPEDVGGLGRDVRYSGDAALIAVVRPGIQLPQGRVALSRLRDFATRANGVLGEMAKPAGFTAKLQQYMSINDPVIKQLMEETRQGDKTAAMKLQQAVIDRELGGGE
jgi:hypothetical protein